jgi:hypothetical protein
LRWCSGEEPAVARRHQLLRSRTGVTLPTAAATLSLVSLGWLLQLALVGFDALAALGWLFWCTEDAVRRAADTYARQLFVALEVLADGLPAEEAKPVDDPA